MTISWKRNLAIKQCETEYLFLLDDDNRIFDWKFLEKIFKKYNKIERKYGDCIVSPIIYRRDTNIIQSGGIKFCYIFWKVFVNKKIKWDYWLTYWMWWNSLFWRINFFKKCNFDENIWFIREDIDYTYSLREKWVKIFVVNEKINHMERKKTLSEKSFISWELFKKKIRNIEN